MPFYTIWHVPPAGFPCDWSCLVGAISAESEATADRMAEERYVMRPGFDLELLICNDQRQTDEAKFLIGDWHKRDDFFRKFCRDLGVTL